MFKNLQQSFIKKVEYLLQVTFKNKFTDQTGI